MRRLPTSPSSSAFTLIELLVAMAVLALVSVILATMLSATSQTWLRGQARVNNFIKARGMLDLLARDLQSGVFRSDLGAFPDTNDAFYTERPGFVSGGSQIRNVSLVEYSLGTTNTILQRKDLAIAWTDAADSISFGTNTLPKLAAATARDTAPGIVGFRILFLGTNGQLSTNYSAAATPRTFAVGIAVVDDKTLDRLTDVQIQNLRTAFLNSASGTNSLKADWENYLRTGFDWSQYPKSLGSGLKVFERYVSVP